MFEFNYSPYAIQSPGNTQPTRAVQAWYRADDQELRASRIAFLRHALAAHAEGDIADTALDMTPQEIREWRRGRATGAQFLTRHITVDPEHGIVSVEIITNAADTSDLTHRPGTVTRFTGQSSTITPYGIYDYTVEERMEQVNEIMDALGVSGNVVMMR